MVGKFSKLGILLFVFGFLALNSFAQTDSCALQLAVTPKNGGDLVREAAATLFNKKTGKIYKSSLKDENPYFAELSPGFYRVTVRKVGYMRSADDIFLECSQAVTIRIIELYKGSSLKIVKLYNRPTYRAVLSNSDNKDLPTAPVAKSKPVPKTIAGGVINGKATNLVRPSYSAEARANKASGEVYVQVTIDEEGNVISATAVSGHPMLREVCEKAALASKFNPTLLSGQPVKVTGIIIYNFVP